MTPTRLTMGAAFSVGRSASRVKAFAIASSVPKWVSNSRVKPHPSDESDGSQSVQVVTAKTVQSKTADITPNASSDPAGRRRAQTTHRMRAVPLQERRALPTD